MTIRNKDHLIKALAEVTGESQAATRRTLDALTDYVTATLRKNGRAIIPGVGRLSLSYRHAREGRRPTDSALVTFPARNVVKLTTAQPLKDAVQPRD